MFHVLKSSSEGYEISDNTRDFSICNVYRTTTVEDDILTLFNTVPNVFTAVFRFT